MSSLKPVRLVPDHHSNHSAGKFYSARQIYVAAFVGGPPAAAWLMSRNFVFLSDQPRASRFLWLGLGATIVAIAVAYSLPDSIPRFIWPLTYSGLIYQYARRLFESLYYRQNSEACAVGSWWLVVAVSLLGMLAVVGVAIGAEWLLETLSGQHFSL
jgi:hypothetical protein